jgi:hypothetical protein
MRRPTLKCSHRTQLNLASVPIQVAKPSGPHGYASETVDPVFTILAIGVAAKSFDVSRRLLAENEPTRLLKSVHVHRDFTRVSLALTNPNDAGFPSKQRLPGYGPRFSVLRRVEILAQFLIFVRYRFPASICLLGRA